MKSNPHRAGYRYQKDYTNAFVFTSHALSGYATAKAEERPAETINLFCKLADSQTYTQNLKYTITLTAV